jgi:hypothetical protein
VSKRVEAAAAAIEGRAHEQAMHAPAAPPRILSTEPGDPSR